MLLASFRQSRAVYASDKTRHNAMVTPLRKAASYEPRIAILGIWGDSTWLTRGKYGSYVAVRGSYGPLYCCVSYVTVVLRNTWHYVIICYSYGNYPKLVVTYAHTMDGTTNGYPSLPNEFMHLSVSKVSQWHFKHASPLWCNDRHRHFSRIETRQCSAKSINLMRRRKLCA